VTQAAFRRSRTLGDRAGDSEPRIRSKKIHLGLLFVSPAQGPAAAPIVATGRTRRATSGPAVSCRLADCAGTRRATPCPSASLAVSRLRYLVLLASLANSG
jgi:hypothetical protein